MKTAHAATFPYFFISCEAPNKQFFSKNLVTCSYCAYGTQHHDVWHEPIAMHSTVRIAQLYVEREDMRNKLCVVADGFSATKMAINSEWYTTTGKDDEQTTMPARHREIMPVRCTGTT